MDRTKPPSLFNLPDIVINDVKLSDGQVLAIHMALQEFAIRKSKGKGKIDNTGILDRIKEINNRMGLA